MQSTGINRWKEPHEAVQAKKVLSYHLNTRHITNITIAEDFGSITDEKKNAFGWKERNSYLGNLLPNASSRMEKDLVVFEKSTVG